MKTFTITFQDSEGNDLYNYTIACMYIEQAEARAYEILNTSFDDSTGYTIKES